MGFFALEDAQVALFIVCLVFKLPANLFEVDAGIMALILGFSGEDYG